MEIFSLNAIIDNILLLVRNNNISESEDLSRAQIEQWVHQYRAMLIKQDADKGYNVENYGQELNPMELIKVPNNDIDNWPIDDPGQCIDKFYYRTKDKLPGTISFHEGASIFHVTDMQDCTIQPMSRTRRHFQWLRKYTGKEYTYHYIGDYLWVQGPDALRYIKVFGIFTDPTQAGLSPDDQYPMPVDKLGALNSLIFDHELKFMLSRPSDDKNNASLAGLKPNNNE